MLATTAARLPQVNGIIRRNQNYDAAAEGWAAEALVRRLEAAGYMGVRRLCGRIGDVEVVKMENGSSPRRVMVEIDEVVATDTEMFVLEAR